MDESAARPARPRLPRIAGPCSIVIFGVTGDLSRKKLLPAIYDLADPLGLLPPSFGLDRSSTPRLDRGPFQGLRQGERAGALPYAVQGIDLEAAAARFVSYKARSMIRKRSSVCPTPSPSSTATAVRAATTRSTCRCRPRVPAGVPSGPTVVWRKATRALGVV